MPKEETKKQCPFREGLRCRDCRFYQSYIGGQDKKRCLFENMVDYLFALRLTK